MLGEVIEAAAALADEAEPTVTEALIRYQRLLGAGSREAQIWVSVAFLLNRHAELAPTLACARP